MRYQELLAQLQLEADSRELLECTTSGPGPGAPDEHPEQQQQQPDPPDHNVEWAAEVRDAIYDLGVCQVVTTLGRTRREATQTTGWNPQKELRREEVAAHFNLWLLAGYPPTPLRRGETVLIAKEAGANTPEKHRPITISDIILRCFQKVLASRFETSLPWNPRQKAFVRGDGVADSIWLLQTIIRQHQRTFQPLNIAFLDIKKAFDSVSHESLLLAAGKMGVPPPMLGYLGELYGDAWTCLRIGSQ